MSYSASLRQQAKWIREALDPTTEKTQRIDLGDVDTDELDAAADHIDILLEEVSVLRGALMLARGDMRLAIKEIDRGLGTAPLTRPHLSTPEAS